MTKLPLEGIRVLNLGSVASAPATCRIFAEFGAEVIRAETSKRMDTLRMMQTVADMDKVAPEDRVNVGGNFNELNRGVKSFLCNYKNPKAVELVKKLVKISDVVVENYSPGTMRGLGLDYEVLKQVKPDIIMLSLSAVGQYGPYSDMLTYGTTIAAISGEQSMLGYPDGESAQDYGSADFMAGGAAAFCILMALRYRKQTGKGQWIDLGQVEPTIYTLGEPLMELQMNSRVPGKQGNWRTGFVPNNNYRCKPNPNHPIPDDQWVSISVDTEEEWQSLCKAMGHPEWMSNADFASKEKRWKNQEELDRLIGEWTINYTNYQVMEMLQKAGVAAMVMMDEPLILADPHFKAQQTIKTFDIPYVKDLPIAAPPIRMSDYECVWRRAPNMGEHTDYVYGELLGLTKEEIEALRKEGAIV